MNDTGRPPEPQTPDGGRRAERRSSPELAVYLWNGSLQHQAPIRDISSTGIYLLTDERWVLGDLVSMTLQRRGPIEGNFERRFSVKAKAVRWGEDGVAFSFVLPDGMDLRLWQNPFKSPAEQADPENILREFRIARAIALLRVLSPEATDRIRRLLREGLSNYRVSNATEIALRAERMLSFTPGGERMRASSNLLLRILEDGSWAEGEMTQQFWAGLLATSCSPGGQDESNRVFVSLLSQLTAPHLRILAAACTRGAKYLSASGRVAARPLVLTPPELIQISGMRDLSRVHRDLEYLCDLGLLKPPARPRTVPAPEGLEIVPTTLALQLFASANGHRGSLNDFYHLPLPGEREEEPSEAETIKREGSAGY